MSGSYTLSTVSQQMDKGVHLDSQVIQPKDGKPQAS